MKTLFTAWGLGALALAGIIHFAHSPEQGLAHGQSLATAAVLGKAFSAEAQDKETCSGVLPHG